MSKKTSPSQRNEVKNPVESVKRPVTSPEMASRAMNLREMYISLPKYIQDAVVHFFNANNIAGYLYNEVLSQDARDYVDKQIKYTQELNALEDLYNSPSEEVFNEKRELLIRQGIVVDESVTWQSLYENA